MGLHYSDRVQRKVIEVGNRGGALAPLIEEVQRLMDFLQANAGADQELLAEIGLLRSFAERVERGLLTREGTKGVLFQSLTRSRGETDYRMTTTGSEG